MAANSRLTIAAHALTWLALAHGRGRAVLTSDEVAASIDTNPVIVRRSLGDLRRAGLVTVRQGLGAGWRLARPANEITLLDVHDAVSPAAERSRPAPVFALHHSEPNLACPVGRGIRPALTAIYEGVDDSMRRELSRTTIAGLLGRALPTPIVELRQYTLHPGRRDELIELFDREFVETQEACGMAVLGQFRDLDDPDRFVWLRGFPDMATRGEALSRFYGGPVWAAHKAAANATMVDSDNVLLLRTDDLVLDPADRPADATTRPTSRFLLTIEAGAIGPANEAGAIGAANEAGVGGAGALATLRTEHADNNFPALPIRTDVDVRVSVYRFDDEAALRRVPAPPPGVQHLRLAPTARSLLR